MRYRTSAMALALGALAATPCLALTIQAAPATPDVAQHLHAQSTPASSLLPGPDQLKDSFAASGRSQLGQGFYSSGGAPRTTSSSFGPFRATTTVTPGYGASWTDTGPRDRGNPFALTPPRP